MGETHASRRALNAHSRCVHTPVRAIVGTRIPRRAHIPTVGSRKPLVALEGGVNSAFFKFFKDRETFEEFSCKTLLYHRDKSQQHTRDLYWFGLLTYSSPQATPLENSLKTLVKTPYKKQGTLANTCPCASLFSTSFARDNLTFHTSTTQSIAFDDLVAEI